MLGPLPPVPPARPRPAGVELGALDAIGLRLAADWPADCNADAPGTGRPCDLKAGHDGQHVAGLTWWTS